MGNINIQQQDTKEDNSISSFLLENPAKSDKTRLIIFVKQLPRMENKL